MTLQRLVDQKVVTADQLAEIAGYGRSTIYAWMGETADPDAGCRIRIDAVMSWLQSRRLPLAARDAILDTMTGGLATLRERSPHDDLDLDGNGVIDEADQMAAVARGIEAAARELSVITEANSNGARSSDEHLRVSEVCRQIKADADRVQEIDRIIFDRDNPTRRPAVRMASGGVA